MYLYELVNWLTTVVDSLVVKDAYKDKAYRGAADYIAECFMVSASRFVGMLLLTALFQGLPDRAKRPDDQRERRSQSRHRH